MRKATDLNFEEELTKKHQTEDWFVEHPSAWQLRNSTKSLAVAMRSTHPSLHLARDYFDALFHLEVEVQIWNCR